MISQTEIKGRLYRLSHRAAFAFESNVFVVEEFWDDGYEWRLSCARTFTGRDAAEAYITEAGL